MKKSKLILIIIVIIVISFPIFRYIEDGEISPLFKVKYIQKDNKVIYVSKNYITNPFDARIFKDNRLAIKENNKYGYINEKGEIVIPIKYDIAKDFSEGLAAVSLNGKWFFIDKTGKIIIDCKEDYPDEFSEGLATVSLNGKWFLIDKTGKIIIDCKDNYPNDFSDGVSILSNNTVIDKRGKALFIKKEHSDNIYIGGMLITSKRINNKDKYGFFDKTGKLICPYKYDYINSFDNGVTTARINKDWYIIDKTGKRLYLLGSKYIDVQGFSDGLARVLSKKLCVGFIDKTGKEVIPCAYIDASNFNEGLCKLNKYEKCGYINKQGKVIIPFKYDFGFDVADGLALVYTDKKRFMYIDKNNKEVIKLRFYIDFVPFPFCDNIAAVSYISNLNIFTTKNNTIN